jgi:hypothetical protein
MGGIAEALRRGSGKTPGALELERKHRDLEKVVTQPSIRVRIRPTPQHQ